MNKRIALIVFEIFVAGAVAVVGASLLGQSQRNAQADSQKKEEEATRIQEGQVTEKQRQHSRLFKHPGKKLRDIASRQKGDVEVEEGIGLMMVLPRSGAQLPVFHSALCNADAVIVGVINDKSSQLTEEENFIFTDYQISVEEVIKNNIVEPIHLANAITGLRDGGAVELNNRIFRAKREDFDPPVVGQRYLLFLRFIPATGSYLMYGNGTFQLDSQRILALGPAARDELTKSGVSDSPSFLGQIRTFANRGCQGK
jgi:hypothetical protein